MKTGRKLRLLCLGITVIFLLISPIQAQADAAKVPKLEMPAEQKEFSLQPLPLK